jgi:hypothetical protein
MKLNLSKESGYGHGFRQGVFVRLFEQSLWRFAHTVRQLKPQLEKVKGGGLVIYGGLPIKSFEVLLAENRLACVEEMEYGWRWSVDEVEIKPSYDEWRVGILSETKNDRLNERNVLAELKEFNLSLHTPMEAMNKVLDWQKYLKNREGAG